MSIVAAAVAVLVVLTGSWGAYRALTNQLCGQKINLSLSAAPEIAPAVRETMAKAEGELRSGDKCVSVEVISADPADVAAAIANHHGSSLGGLGQASVRTKVPDVWIPDSSMWLQRLRSGGQDWVPDDAQSVARSPVVLAMPESAATALGWPNKKLTWTDLFPRLISDIRVRSGVVEPTRDAAGLSGLLALVSAGEAVGGSAGRQTTVGALRAFAIGRSALREDLLARFPRSTDVTSAARSLTAAPLTEQAVISYNSKQPPVPLAALYVDPAPVPLDYPFAVMPGTSVDKGTAAGAVLALLAGDAYRNRLAAVGLRGDDGGVGAGFAAPRGAPSLTAPTATPPDPGRIETLLSTWTTVTSPGRMLAVIDVSSSMTQPVPSAGGATRQQVTIEAALRGLALFDDTWSAGLWIFSTQLDGANDYRQLVPIAPLSEQRQQLLAALGEVKSKRDGGNGLYDTTLAAYKAVQAGWDPSRVNSVVIMTDGMNDDQSGLSLDQLVEELRRVADPARPVQVIAVGIGNDVVEGDLKRITDTTGGGTFTTSDPSKVGDLFLKAIALRTGVRR
ncbi:substrate-binding domain-containing protein [Planosporangium mesophilum]|uniref:substrate-binding domain-containing protein n=1 Tax=Planosporangium mesophilum TaxID=689768 RepID=UPI00143C6D14|nr:substrate-binding domain-containing protein [Planosporangium mesophilum]NJC81960.1 VWA domain-containing protein [Planosporangium mesophilum]